MNTAPTLHFDEIRTTFAYLEGAGRAATAIATATATATTATAVIGTVAVTLHGRHYALESA